MRKQTVQTVIQSDNDDKPAQQCPMKTVSK